MPYDRFLIASFNNSDSGLHTDLRPWKIPDDAFQQLSNAYVFRGRVRKRFGSTYMGQGNADASPFNQLFSRFRINVGTTDAITGDLSGTVPGIVWEPGQMFSIGDALYTVVSDTPGAQPMLQTITTPTATFDVSTGDFVFIGAPLDTDVFFYPAQPVMGLGNFEIGPINNQPLYGFDTQFAYLFSPTLGWIWQATPIWTGDDLNFFWTTNWRGVTADVTVLFVTNYNSAAGTPAIQDPIWSFDGTWSIFTPFFLPLGGAPSTGSFVQTALIILSFKNRLILLNTIEFNNATSVNQVFVNRCRYSFVGSPLAVNAWYERGQTDTSGNVGAGAGFTDATTEDARVSAEFIKDRLIVYFDRSTWELVYTGNQAEPFVWQKINTELGSQSTFSTVPFDKFVLTIGNTGVHSCNGANVQRIDNNIPELIFDIQDVVINDEEENETVKRICGIRDYFTEMVYWSIPSDQDTGNFPNNVLVYNYKTGAWAVNDDSITAFGYYEQQADTTWSEVTTTWNESNFTWVDGIVQSDFRQVVAGNQEGYTFIINPNVTRNAGVLQVTNISEDDEFNVVLTIYNHNLSITDYILVENAQGFSNFVPFIAQVLYVTDENTIGVSQLNVYIGAYTGGGTAARVSQIYMLTKQFNPYLKEGQNVFISKIDFGVKKTLMGQITVDYFPSATTLSMIAEGQATGAILGTNVLETYPYDPLYYPLEGSQERLWHTIYFQASGECIQLAIYFNNAQMVDPESSLVDFQLEGMVLYTNPAGRLE